MIYHLQKDNYWKESLTYCGYTIMMPRDFSKCRIAKIENVTCKECLKQAIKEAEKRIKFLKENKPGGGG